MTAKLTTDWTERDRFREDTLAEIERLKLQRGQLDRTAERLEEEVDALVALSVRLGIETLPVADAHPVMHAICRAELARAMLHVRRAGRICVRMGVVIGGLEEALAGITRTGGLVPRAPK